MDSEKRFGGERLWPFVPRHELNTIQKEIDSLRGVYSLNPHEQDRLRELQAITRRDFLAKALSGLGLVAAGAAATYVGFHREPVVFDEPKERPVKKPAPENIEKIMAAEAADFHLELPKNLERQARVQAIVMEYNRWFLEGPKAELIKPGRAIEVFVELYNQMRSQTENDPSIPTLTVEDFDSPEIIQKLISIEDGLREKDYFVRFIPTSTATGDFRIPYVAIISGKVVSEKQRVVERHGTQKSYTHLSVDKEKADDPIDKYMTRATWVSAMTYQRDPDSPFQVVQMRWAYEDGASARYERLIGTGTSERDRANRFVFSDYHGLPREEAVEKITDRMQASSHLHEIQHVFDDFPSDIEQGGLGKEYLAMQRVIGETRGLLGALLGEDPKSGLLNIYMWQDAPDSISATIGKTAADVLYDASGYELSELLRLTDEDLNRIGMNTLTATDTLFNALLVQGHSIKSKEAKSADEIFVRELEALRIEEQKRNSKK